MWIVFLHMLLEQILLSWDTCLFRRKALQVVSRKMRMGKVNCN